VSQSRFTGGLLAALVLAGAGAASGRSALFVAAVIPLVFVLYGALSVPRADDGVHVTRDLSTESPLPGDRVAVELTVENVGGSALPDVRVADGVPGDLRVVDGSPDAALALPADGTATVEYTIVADRGQFPFDSPTVRVRGASATNARTVDAPVDGTDELNCQVSVADVPLRRQTTAHAGTLPTDSGGPGIEFHSTREYQRGDPASRINWRRYAKTGELSTVNYRERRAAAVVLAVDARDASDATAHAGTPSGASLSAYAAARAVEPLETAGHRVGLAVFGIDDPVTGGTDPAWVPPGTGDAHHARIATVLDAAVEGGADDAETTTEEAEPEQGEKQVATADGGSWLGAGDDARIDRFAERVPPGTQVVVCSPVLDEFPVALTRRLAADGHHVTAVSPDVTATDTPGRTLAATDRALSLSDLRAAGAHVVDWSPDEPLASAVARATTTIRGGQR
jgi:uncharacterized protein (DUF58 family)